MKKLLFVGLLLSVNAGMQAAQPGAGNQTQPPANAGQPAAGTTAAGQPGTVAQTQPTDASQPAAGNSTQDPSADITIITTAFTALGTALNQKDEFDKIAAILNKMLQTLGAHETAIATSKSGAQNAPAAQ